MGLINLKLQASSQIIKNKVNEIKGIIRFLFIFLINLS